MLGHTGEGSDLFWHLSSLSNVEVLEGLQASVGRSRQLLALVVAHLGEVEERRLHLQDGCGSMFDYCVRELAFSEDEACRRIEVARLARRFPELFPLLARGELSLTVAASLKPFLSPQNATELLVAVSCCTVRQAREALAARFPRPDVPSVVRKLPERLPLQPALPATKPATTVFGASQHPSFEAVVAPNPVPPLPVLPLLPARRTLVPSPSTVSPASRPHIEPLSAARYKIQLTAGLELKNKLELARDLMRHAIPSGDYATILERALDLLIERHMKRRFGAGARKGAARSPGASSKPRSNESLVEPATAVPEPARVSRPSTPSNATRRSVLERDGLRCSWVSESGERCEARAWLELDHRHPRAKGGGPDPENMRLLCRNHNQWAAELELGRAHIERKRHSDISVDDADAVAHDINARGRRSESSGAQRSDGSGSGSLQE